MFRDPGNLPWNNNGMASGETAEAAAPLAIGQIQKASGSVTVTRVTGVVVAVKPGDLVTEATWWRPRPMARSGFLFADGTTFSLSEGARMALDEYTCDPKGVASSALFRLARGTFAFIAGKLAKACTSDRYPLRKHSRAYAREWVWRFPTLAALTFSVLQESLAQPAGLGGPPLDPGGLPLGPGSLPLGAGA